MPRSDADQALLELRRADRLLNAMAVEIGGLFFHPFIRKRLMSFKDEIKAALDEAATNVRSLRDAKEAAHADAEAKQGVITTLEARIAELEAMPGAWEQKDIDEVKAALATLKKAFDPETTVANIFANTPNDGGGAEEFRNPA